MVLDFILIFTIIICFFMGYKKGFTSMFVSLILFVFSIVLVANIYDHLEKSFFNSDFGSGIVEDISDNINKEIDTLKMKVTTQAPFLNKYFADGPEKNKIIGNAVNDLSLKALQTLVSVPLVIIAFLLFKLLLKLVKFFASKTRNLPIIGGIDSVLGSSCGLVAGVVLVAVIYMATCYLQFIPSAPFVAKQLEDSLVIMLITDFFLK